VRAKAALFLALAASSAGAVDLPTPQEPLHLDITSTSIGAWHFSNGNQTSCDDNYGEAHERLNVNASYGRWVAGVRLDGSVFIAPPQPRDAAPGVLPCYAVELDTRYKNALTPEKVWVGWNGRDVEVTLGDSYVQFGRGLTLALRKTDQLGLDTSQRGVRLKLDVDRVSAIAVAGFTNINNLDEATGRRALDPNDFVGGAQVLSQLADGVRLGGDAALIMFKEAPSSPAGAPAYAERWFSAGPILDAPRITDWLGLYIEGVMQHRGTADGHTTDGFGLYGTATARLGAITLLLEGKAYGDLQVLQPKFEAIEFQPVQYAVMPTAERVLQPLEHSQRNIYGGRLRADWALNAALNFYVNYGLFRDAEGYLNLDPNHPATQAGTVHDPYFGAEARLGRLRLSTEGGWRVVLLPEFGPLVRGDGHFDLLGALELPWASSVELHATDLERTKVLPFSNEQWREGTVAVSFRKRPWFALSGILDYSTEPGQPQVWYPGGTAEIDFTESSNLRIFAGASRGGLRCVSGVCRIFPPFTGVKGTLTLRF
jgi:hypothetical protein